MIKEQIKKELLSGTSPEKVFDMFKDKISNPKFLDNLRKYIQNIFNENFPIEEEIIKKPQKVKATPTKISTIRITQDCYDFIMSKTNNLSNFCSLIIEKYYEEEILIKALSQIKTSHKQ